MKLRRVRQVTVNEFVVRGSQEVSKWFDRMTAGKPLVTGSKHMAARTLRRGQAAANGHRGASAVLDHFRERVPLSFFESAMCPDTTARLVARIPGSRDRIMSTADMITQGRFDLLGYHGLDYGVPVDWHLDPVSGRRSPLIHWSRLDPLDPAVVGDSKIIWELNRHQWLLHLGQAYRFTGDERYAEAFARYVQEWMRANPAGMGINWASSLEVAFRLISWCWALVLFNGSRALSRELLVEMLAGIRDHARHVERYLSVYFSPNTHLTGEALGLFYAGVLFPYLPRAQRWRAQSAAILVKQCQRHMLPDGVYFEQSTYYQRYAAEIYLHFLILAARNGIGVPDIVADRLQRLLDFLVAVRQPDGSMQQIGDADGGWLLPLLPRTPDDLRGLFSVAAAFFGRSDYAWAAGALTPEALWLLGPTAATVFGALTPAPPQSAPSRLFPDGGYVVMRNGWERDAHHLVFDVGPLGCPISGVHGHADLLSIQCSGFGTPYLVDPGTYCYTADRRSRDYFRGTAAHSTVRVDAQEQAVPAGPFKWQTRPCARLRQWLSTDALDFADADHDAYGRLQDPVRHRRRILFKKPRFWMVVDDLEGAAEHRVELTFQFAPLDVTVDSDLWTRARGSGESALLVRPFAHASLAAKISTGEVAPMRGWISPGYGWRQPAPTVTYATVTKLPLRVITLLLPTSNPRAPAPSVAPLIDDHAMLAGLVFTESGECVRFDDLGVSVTGSG